MGLYQPLAPKKEKKEGLSTFTKLGLATIATATLLGLGALARRQPPPTTSPTPVVVQVPVVVTATPTNTPTFVPLPATPIPPPAPQPTRIPRPSNFGTWRTPPMVLPTLPPLSPYTIAFVDYNNTVNEDDNEIYTMNIDRTRIRRLTDNNSAESGASWSPDGRQLVFHSNRDGHYQIYVMNADGSNQRRLMTSDYNDEWAYWSPRGDKIVFDRIADHNNDGIYHPEVFIMNADGTGLRRLTFYKGESGGYAHGCWPSGWSPDGKQILYYCYQEEHNQLYTMNADGSNQSRLLEDGQWNSIPTMLPDGRILFSSYRTGNMEVYLMDANRSSTRRLTSYSGEDWRPIGSPDGQLIMFERKDEGTSFRTDDKTSIYVMDNNGYSLQFVVEGGQFAWKPSGY